MTIAIVIARGGSKRLPRKNVRPFCGHPLVAWSIVQALCSHRIDKVFLSTDDNEIAEIGAEYGAEIIMRPDWPNPDELSANPVFRHAIGLLLDAYGDKFDTVLSILPTSPVQLPSDFDRAIKMLKTLGLEEINTQVPQRETVINRKIHPFYYRTTVFDKKYNYLVPGMGWSITSPRRYLALTEPIADTDREIDDAMAGIPANPKVGRLEVAFLPVNEWQRCDVDTLEEFELAEVLFEHYVLKGRGMEVFYEYAKEKTKIL